MSDRDGHDAARDGTREIREIAPAEVMGMLERAAPCVYLDVREPNEFNLGHLPGAVHIPRGLLEVRVEGEVPRDATVVVYCSAGQRSKLAAGTLALMGYTNVASMAGGLREYVPAGGPLEG